MDASDEYTTVDDSAKDPTYELPTDFRPEPVPQMHVGNSSENEPASPILSATSSRSNNREKRRRGKRDTIEKAHQALFDQRNRTVPSPNPDDNDADDDEVNPRKGRGYYTRKRPNLL